MEEEMLLGGEGEEHKNREALVKLALHFLRKMEQNGMADYLQNSK